MEATTPISFVLTDEHTEEICKVGKGNETCRYLTSSAGSFVCAKFGPLMETLNNKAKNNEMESLGDNCDSLLGEIMQAKESLVGKKVTYTETMPSFSIDGTVKCLDYDKEKSWLTIKIVTGKETFPYEVNTESLEINDSPNYIKFGVCGLGAFAGSLKIYK